jgi:PAS domain S-box-containing protein
MDVVGSFMARSGFLPHGYCFTWDPGLLWSMVGSDAIIAASYFSIPVAILFYVRKRTDVAWGYLPLLFSAFIFACGTTHVMDVWTIWNPDYGVHAATKVATAVVSLVTAVALWPLMPRLLKVPTVGQLQAAIVKLESEVQRRVTAEDSLVELQQSLSITLESIEAGFIATDREGRVIRLNAVAERFTGWSEPAALGKPLYEVFASDDRPADIAALNPVDHMLKAAFTVDTRFDVVSTSRAGVRTPIEVRAALTHSRDGTVRGLAMVMRDLSRLNRAEIEANRLAAIVASSSDAIIGKTLDGRITSWNAAAEKMFGYSAAEAIGQSVQMLLPRDRLDEEMRIINDLTSEQLAPAFDARRLTKDGRVLDVSITISPIRDAAGRVVGASKIARDLSAQLKAERELRRLEAENLQIQEASRLKSQFLANMSHELRTPLNAIIGFADLLGSGAVKPDSPKHRTFLGHIGTSGRHLLQLINDVLDLSKVESGKLEFFPEPVNLSLLVKEVGDVLHAATIKKRIAIVAEIAPGLDDLRLDPARLKQVLYNYLSNAIKFSPEGSRVTVRAMAEGVHRFRIEVEDAGIGIAPADIGRLFVEFQQLDSGLNKQHEGTGLGLALTRRLVEAQGGSVGVASTPGQGSVFHVVLNRVHGQDPGDEAGRSAEAVETEQDRVLVIQAAREDQTRLLQLLADAGFAVDAAATGEHALRQAIEHGYQAITLDLVLGDRNGLDVLSSIRDQGPSRRAPVVGLSMPTNGNAVNFAIADILSKPIRTEEVLAAMAPYRLAGPGRPPVMVIDDDPLAVELMRSALQSIGVESVCFTDPRQALDEIELHRPEAIVLDLMMPVVDGFAVLDALSRMPSCRDIPVFIWTSMILTDEEYASLTQSAAAIVGKGGGALAAMLDKLRRHPPGTPVSRSGTQS